MTIAQLDVAPDLSRPLPQSPDAERAILGSILIRNECFFRIKTAEHDFFRDAHRTIYRTMAYLLTEEHVEVDHLSLREHLGRNSQLEEVGGSAYIASLVDNIPDIARVEQYAVIVEETARRRRIITTSYAAIRKALDGEKPAAEIASKAAAKLTESTTEARGESKPVYDVVIEVERVQAARAAEGRTRAIRTGFKSLDYNMAFRRMAMTTVTAPSSHGKTVFMLKVAVNALREDAAVRAAVHSFEMHAEDLYAPLLSMMSGVLIARIQRGETNEMDNYAIKCAKAEMAEWARNQRFYFSGMGVSRDIESVHTDCLRRNSRSGLDLIVIDHIQLIRGYGGGNREQDIDRIASTIRYMGEEMNAAMLVGSQVNKDREKRGSGRLSNQDHKGGAVIGETADVALMFQRPRQDDKANRDIEWCATHFQVEKNRGHETGDIPMHADMPTQTFAEGTCETNNCRWLKGFGPVQQKLNA